MRTYFFDSTGLRFPVSFLNFMLSKMWRLSIEEQAEFVDGVTYEHCKTGIPVIKGDEDINRSTLNTTSIGNIAFITLYHPDTRQRQLGSALYQRLKPT